MQVTGQGGVPADAKAVLANVTVTGPTGSGFLTDVELLGDQPEVSTLNFSRERDSRQRGHHPARQQSAGCAPSAASSADLIIDVGGYYSASAAGRYMPVSPVRLMDSRDGIGTPARLAGGQVVELPVVGVAGVPTDASAVALNVTGILPTVDAYVTAFPCGDDARRPPASTQRRAGSRRTS